MTWNYRDGFSDSENAKNAERVKYELESLIHSIDGIIEIKVHINELNSSNRDVVLNSLFENYEALYRYQQHPAHQKVSAFVGTVMQNRACIDYYE